VDLAGGDGQAGKGQLTKADKRGVKKKGGRQSKFTEGQEKRTLEFELDTRGRTTSISAKKKKQISTRSYRLSMKGGKKGVRGGPRNNLRRVHFCV